MNLVELKHVKDKNVENENVESGLIPFEPTLFKYKCKIRMLLLQIIHTVLMKKCAEAALIALSIFFLSTFFTCSAFSFHQIHTIQFTATKFSDKSVQLE
jgi:hypothetical protein